MGIEDILMYDESLFQNINAFDPDYVPPNYNFRDTQMEAMAMSIRPALRGGKPSNAVVLGSPATGKTTAMRKVFDFVEKTSEKVICVYINCQLHTTRFGIFSQIFKKIFGHIPPETGIPFARIYDQIMKDLQKNDKSLVVALDDINYLFQSKNANKVVGAEVVENAVNNAKRNAKLNNITNTEFVLQDLNKGINISEKFDTFILDPPRSGISHKIMQLLLKELPNTIVYVSCDPQTFVRDLNELKDKYIIKKIYSLDMFSYTYHCESITVLERR